jgi:hypothetical protein
MTERSGSAGYEPWLSYQSPTFAAPRPRLADADVHQPATYVAPRQPPPRRAPLPRASGVVRHGPGVPGAAGAAATRAEDGWRTGRHAGPPPRRRGLGRVRRILGLALTLILLAAAGLVVWLGFHHAPFDVTGVAITQRTKTTCGVDVTGRIATNGSAGTVSYQWVFRPQTQAPQPLSQSVVAGQHSVYVTVAVEGQGHGSAVQKVTLDILGPGSGTASTAVNINC